MCPRWQASGIANMAVLDIVYIRFSDWSEEMTRCESATSSPARSSTPKDLVAQAWCARHFTAPPIYVSGFGPRSARLAARIGDGYCLVAPRPEMVERFRTAGGGDKAGTGRAQGLLRRRRRGQRCPPTIGSGPTSSCPVSWRRCSHAGALRAGVQPGDTRDGGGDRALRTGPRRAPRGYPALRNAGVDELYAQQIGGTKRRSSAPARRRCCPIFGGEPAGAGGGVRARRFGRAAARDRLT
jgi:hypothetical protein